MNSRYRHRRDNTHRTRHRYCCHLLPGLIATVSMVAMVDAFSSRSSMDIRRDGHAKELIIPNRICTYQLACTPQDSLCILCTFYQSHTVPEAVPSRLAIKGKKLSLKLYTCQISHESGKFVITDMTYLYPKQC